MQKQPKVYVYLDKLRWDNVMSALGNILPNYNVSDITRVMCEYGFTSDWRKAEALCWAIKMFSNQNCTGQPDSINHVRATTSEEALRLWKPQMEWGRCSGPKVTPERWQYHEKGSSRRSYVLIELDPRHEQSSTSIGDFDDE